MASTMHVAVASEADDSDAGGGAAPRAGADGLVETNNAAELRRRFVDLGGASASSSLAAAAPSLLSSDMPGATTSSTTTTSTIATTAGARLAFLSPMDLAFVEETRSLKGVSQGVSHGDSQSVSHSHLAFKPGSIFFNEALAMAAPPPTNAQPPISTPVRPSRNALFDARQTISKPASKMTPEELAALRRGSPLPTFPPLGESSPQDPMADHGSNLVAPPPGFPPQLPPPALTSPQPSSISIDNTDGDLRSITVPVQRRPNLPPQQAGSLAASNRPPADATGNHQQQQQQQSDMDPDEYKSILQREQMLKYQHQQPTDPSFRSLRDDDTDRHIARITSAFGGNGNAFGAPGGGSIHNNMPQHIPLPSNAATSLATGAQSPAISTHAFGTSPVLGSSTSTSTTYPSSSPAYADAAFLRSLNTSSRRGFIDLDEYEPRVGPAALGDRSRPPSIPSYTPSSMFPGSASTSTPYSESKPAPNIPFALSSLLVSPKQAQAQQAQRQRRPSQLDPKDRRITHPGVWDRINLSFLPTNKNFLGEGRYAQVYLGYYAITPEPSSPKVHSDGSGGVDADDHDGSAMAVDTTATTTNIGSAPPTDALCPCAVKRMHPTVEAQSIGLAESYILRRVSLVHPNIISLIGVKDETVLDAPAVKSKLLQGLDTPGGGVVSATTCTNGRITPLNGVGSSSTSAGGSATKPGPSMSATSSGTPGAASRIPDPNPRLLLILEYSPNGNLWDWTMRHRTSVGLALWLKWARELAGAIASIHALGIIHHDIKPHNILLTDFLDIRLADFGNACFVPEMDPLEAAALLDAPPAVSAHLLAGRTATQHGDDQDVVMHDVTPVAASMVEQGPSQVSSGTTTSDTQPSKAQQHNESNPITVQTRPLSSSRQRPLSLLVPDVASPFQPLNEPAPRTIRTASQSTTSSAASANSATTPGPLSATSSARHIVPGSPASPLSQSLTNGLGRGTLAYSAPDLLDKSTTYSFPIDMYSLGVTLYTLICCKEPFGLARTSVHMMVGIQRGFFDSGLQHAGRILPSTLTGSVAASATYAYAASSSSASPSSTDGGISFGGIIGDPVDGNWRFQNGEVVPHSLVQLIQRLVDRDPSLRPSAAETASVLDQVFATL